MNPTESSKPLVSRFNSHTALFLLHFRLRWTVVVWWNSTPPTFWATIQTRSSPRCSLRIRVNKSTVSCNAVVSSSLFSYNQWKEFMCSFSAFLVQHAQRQQEQREGWETKKRQKKMNRKNHRPRVFGFVDEIWQHFVFYEVYNESCVPLWRKTTRWADQRSLSSPFSLHVSNSAAWQINCRICYTVLALKNALPIPHSETYRKQRCDLLLHRHQLVRSLLHHSSWYMNLFCSVEANQCVFSDDTSRLDRSPRQHVSSSRFVLIPSW